MAVKKSNAVAAYRSRVQNGGPPVVSSGGKRGGKAPAGGKSQGGKGQWAWIPAAPTAYARQGPVVKAKGKGKSSGADRKYMDKLGEMDSSLKVWVGGLSEKTSWKVLEAHFKSVAKPSVTEVMGKGKACVAFKTAEDAETAIATLNSSELDGKTIEVDVWTQKEKTEKTPGEDKPKRKPVKKTAFTKNVAGANNKSKGDPKMKEKLKTIDDSKKVWIGGLSPKVTWKKLKDHFASLGCDPEITDLVKAGTACCAFDTDEAASSAIAIVNGTDLEDKTIEVDEWTKPERKGKESK